MDTATHHLTACAYCGAAAGTPCTTASGRPATKSHAAREKAADAIRTEQPEAAQRFGYVCKSCGGPSPVGIGYVAPGAAAEEASADLDACACGYSVRPVADDEYLPGTAPAGHPEHATEDTTEDTTEQAEQADATPVAVVALPASVRPAGRPARTHSVTVVAGLRTVEPYTPVDAPHEATSAPAATEAPEAPTTTARRPAGTVEGRDPGGRATP